MGGRGRGRREGRNIALGAAEGEGAQGRAAPAGRNLTLTVTLSGRGGREHVLRLDTNYSLVRVFWWVRVHFGSFAGRAGHPSWAGHIRHPSEDSLALEKLLTTYLDSLRLELLLEWNIDVKEVTVS